MAAGRASGSRAGRRTGDRFGPRADGEASADQGSSTPQPCQTADPYEVARSIVLNQLTARARSRAELEATLSSRNVPIDVATAVLDRMEEVQLVDDAAFAEQWVASRHRSRGLGRRSLHVELYRKGIDPELAAAALGQLDPELERQTAAELVQRKLGSTRGQPTPARARRLVGLLARKGYSGGLAMDVVRQALADEGDELPEVVIDD